MKPITFSFWGATTCRTTGISVAVFAIQPVNRQHLLSPLKRVKTTTTTRQYRAQLLDIIYEPAEAAPGDTILVKAIFAGRAATDSMLS